MWDESVTATFRDWSRAQCSPDCHWFLVTCLLYFSIILQALRLSNSELVVKKSFEKHNSQFNCKNNNKSLKFSNWCEPRYLVVFFYFNLLSRSLSISAVPNRNKSALHLSSLFHIHCEIFWETILCLSRKKLILWSFRSFLSRLYIISNLDEIVLNYCIWCQQRVLTTCSILPVIYYM